MKTKTSKVFWSVLAVTAVTFVSVIILFPRPDSRNSYEQFLRNEYQRIRPAEQPDQPEMAALQDYFMTLDPALHRVPRERLLPALQETYDISFTRHLKSTREPLLWDIVQSNMGGRTRCITFDPNDPSGHKVWAGSVTGGLWYNQDISVPLYWWQPVDDFWSSLSISAIAFDPNDPQTMYVGTGEAFTATVIYRESSGLGVGIFKSTDGGQTWSLLTSTSGFKYVTDIEIRDEDGASVVYAGVVSGYYQGVDHASEPSDGLFRSVDGGETWMQVLPGINGTSDPYPVADVEIASNGRIFVGTMRNLNGDGGSTILYSDNGIIGTWSIFDDYVYIIESNPDYYVPGRVMLASAPSEPDVVYALLDAGYVNNDNDFIYSQGRYIIRTDEGGGSWTSLPIPSGGDYYWATLGWHALTVAVDPLNPDHVYIGGLDVYKSNDGGYDWIQVSDWTGMYWGGGDDYVHADIHDIDFKPGSSNELVVTSDGGVFYTTEATASDPAFQEKNTLYGSLQFYTCDIHPDAGTERYVGGLQDNGTLYYTGSPLTIFSMVSGGDGAYCFFDKDQPQYMITSYYYNNYSVFQNGNWYNSFGVESGIFVNPADYDYRENTLYANACSFGGDQVNYLLRTSGIPANPYEYFVHLSTNTNTWFSCVKFSPHSPASEATLFLGTASGRFYRVTNAQSSPFVEELTWSEFPEANISSIAIGGSEDTLLVTFSNYGVSSVWQSLDGGTTWEDKEGELPDIPVRWAIYHPQSSSQVMLATETGIWTTDNINASSVSWVPDNDGLANVRVDMLRMRTSDNTVLAATHGRGLATTTWDIATGNEEPQMNQVSLSIYPNPSRGLFRVKINGWANGPAIIGVFNGSGKMVFRKVYESNDIRDIMIDLGNVSQGEYILQVTGQATKITRKLIIKST